MKSEWKKVTLGEIVQFYNGKKRPSEEGDIPVYGGNGVLSYTSQSNYEKCIIIGRVEAYCGSVFMEPSKCWVSDNAIAALPKDGIDLAFLFCRVVK